MPVLSSQRFAMGLASLAEPGPFPVQSSAAEDKDNVWMISFLDILTLLLTLFVLLLAFHADEQPQTVTGEPEVAQAAAVPEPAATRPTEPSAVAQQPTSEEPSAWWTWALLAQSPAPSGAEATAAAQATTTDGAANGMAAFSIPEAIADQVELTGTAERINLTVKDEVLFDRASADIKPTGKALLGELAKLLNQSVAPLSIEGHTDSVPIRTARFPSNWELSSARATHVTRLLAAHGVDVRRMRAIGYADTRPRADNDSAEGRARNRRVALVLHLGADQDGR